MKTSNEAVALTAIYLAFGFEQAHREDPVPAQPVYDGWSESCQGQVGIMRQMIWYAELIEQWLESEPRVYPGVFHYEVVEPLGAWLYGCGDLTEDTLKAELARRTAEWMKENGL